MLKEFENIRNDIRHTRITEKKYTEAISKCFNYIDILNKLPCSLTSDDMWFVHHDLGISNKKLGNFNAAIKHELIAINYTNHALNDCDYRYLYSIWLIATCYEELGNIKEAIKLYGECSRAYRLLHDEQQRICCVWNKAKLYRNEKCMLKLIKIYENKSLNISIKTYGDLEYDDVLKEMYSDLFKLYIVEDKAKAFNLLLYNVKNKDLKMNLGKLLEVA